VVVGGGGGGGGCFEELCRRFLLYILFARGLDGKERVMTIIEPQVRRVETVAAKGKG